MRSTRFGANFRCKDHCAHDLQGRCTDSPSAQSRGTRLPTRKYLAQKNWQRQPEPFMPEERHSLPKPPTKYAEHATDDALTPAEINVLRLIAAGNANKQIRPALDYRGNRQESSQVNPVQVGRQRSYACSHDRFEKRNHRAVVHQCAIAANVNEPRFGSTVAFVRQCRSVDLAQLCCKQVYMRCIKR